jgi:flagellar basal-body rod modification protein FlgD
MEVNLTGESQSTGAGIGNAVGGSSLDKDAFLELLVAQLRNQNPLEPMSNTEFVAQLAQFSSVEQLTALNDGVGMLQMQQMGIANTQAASLIGQEVEVRSDTLDVASGDTSVSAGFKLSGDAATVSVNIRDASGAIVRTVDLGPNAAGTVPFTWDLKNNQGVTVPPGSYTMEVAAADEAGGSVSWEAHVRGIVSGVSYESGYPELMIDGSIKAALGDVIGVYPVSDPTSEGATNP